MTLNIQEICIAKGVWPGASCSARCEAYFEAGQAVVAWLEGLQIVQVSLGEEGSATSWVEVREPDLSEKSLRSSRKARAAAKAVVRGLLAGPAAQRKYSFGTCLAEFNIANRDLVHQETAWRAISIAGSIDHADSPLIPGLWKDVVGKIKRPRVWAAIETVAAALLRDRELAGCEVEQFARYAMMNSRDSLGS
jgi:hypothetical protein